MLSRGTPMLRQTRTGFIRLSFANLLLCFLLTGCGDTCFVVTGIFPNTTSTTNPPTCNLGTGNGNITVDINSVRPSPGAPMSPNLQHVFVTLRGIEANPNSVAAEDSPDWQELAPQLATEPVQIDLMATTVSGVSCASRLTRQSVPAGLYHQIGCVLPRIRRRRVTRCPFTTNAAARASTVLWTQITTHTPWH